MSVYKENVSSLSLPIKNTFTVSTTYLCDEYILVRILISSYPIKSSCVFFVLFFFSSVCNEVEEKEMK